MAEKFTQYKTEKTINPDEAKCFGVLAIKPHAVNEGLYSDINDLLSGNNPELAEKLNVPDITIEGLNQLHICDTFIMDPSKVKGACSLLDTFYSDSLDEKFYPILKDVLSGPQIMYLLASTQNYDEFFSTLKHLKGNPRVLMMDGSEIMPPRGVRGALLPTAVRSQHQIETGEPTEEEMRQILSNILHTTDGPVDTCQAIELLVPEKNQLRLKTLGYTAFTGFMNDSIFQREAP